MQLKNTLTALRQPWKWLVVDRKPSQGGRNLDQQWDKLAKIREHWERTITRDTELELEKLQFMVNDVPETAYAVKNLSRQLAGPSEQDMQDLKQCVRHTLGHSDAWLFRDISLNKFDIATRSLASALC